MVKLEHSEGLGDWFALDNDGTNVEGPHDHWVKVLDGMEAGLPLITHTRVCAKRILAGGYGFTSPRNSHDVVFDAAITSAEVAPFIAQAREVLAAWCLASSGGNTITSPPSPEGKAESPAAAPSDPAVPSRREILARWDAAEHLIHVAQMFVEELGAHPHLTRALDLLKRAQSAVADYVDRRPTASEMGFTEGEPIDLRTLQRMNEARVAAFKMDLTDWSSMEWGSELGEEVGEFMGSVLFLGSALSKVLGAVKKRTRAPHPTLPDTDITGKPVPSTESVASELADVVIVASLLASRLGIDLNNAVRAKWNATSAKVGWKERL